MTPKRCRSMQCLQPGLMKQIMCAPSRCRPGPDIPKLGFLLKNTHSAMFSYKNIAM
ncbi:hypothetical protein HNQ59_003065 [Chitinivorax tropicus]|uniref:Uncharacterized protein n=1 Tax=Chitinivorax tropicus TaxID=714531 RepID=A0A840MRM1_9PROT|nr:hypothetical protein [Chitinivorax tropicus]